MWLNCLVNHTLAALMHPSDASTLPIFAWSHDPARMYLGCDGTSSGFLSYFYANLWLVFVTIAPTLALMPLMMVRPTPYGFQRKVGICILFSDLESTKNAINGRAINVLVVA